MPRSNPNNKRQKYLRGAAYWLKNLAFWDRPENKYLYSERTKDELIKRLNP